MALDSYIFAEMPGTDATRLIFTFHGTGGDEHQLAGLARDLIPTATVISPRGDVSEHGAARFFRRTGEGVYDMADLAARTEKLAAFITAHRQRNASTHVIGIGYSNGANILASVLFAHPRLIDDAVLMHPLIPFTPAPNAGLAGKRVLITAGRRDPICPPAMTQRLADFLTAQKAAVTFAWHEGGHEVRPAEIEACRTFFAAQ
jgi:phospholipase/carboxylesterase